MVMCAGLLFAKGEITIATKDTAETVFKLGPQKMNVSKK